VLRFGTDGVRGDAATDLDSSSVAALGRAVAQALGAKRFLIGRDTRASGPRIEAAFAAGLAAAGAGARSLGVMPTPAIAFTAAREGMPAVIVSASHNPWSDNGLKIVGADGRKCTDAQEDAIEAASAGSAPVAVPPEPALSFGADARAEAAYRSHLLGALGGRSLDGLRVVLDCANGAAFRVGPEVLREAGAEVTAINADPDGRNINDGCGSTHPDALRSEVVARGADLGLALDGDADRVLAVDERGELVDGDQIIVMTACDLHDRGELPGPGVVVTVMSNLGLRRALASAGIEVAETPVGDRHVVAAMHELGYAVGGEQSGHVIYAAHATTGDGLLTGAFVCDLVRRSGVPLSELAARMTRYPQVLVNVRVAQRAELDASAPLRDAIRAETERLGDEGRVLVRASGTEPVVRVMAEAATEDEATQAAARLRDAVVAAFGGSGQP